MHFSRRTYMIAVTCYYVVFTVLLFNPIPLILPQGAPCVDPAQLLREQQIDEMSDDEYLEYRKTDAFFDMKDKDKELSIHHERQKKLWLHIKMQNETGDYWSFWRD